ncbi:hypothetical protein [Parendozoicomonas sp. Alg238-R29]|uniref:hypothetical protein n=1 Tax=Parendozoicomonas sp. Alg238-R29 TaxID=2993446 RepID=UPI00248F28FD|nr:hypothetical protein [Parendozoicomonas sp. Alg238-R29]
MTAQEAFKDQSLNSLVALKKQIERLIEEKQNEDKTPLWIVEDTWVHYAAYPIDQFDKAVEKMAELTLKQSKVCPNASFSFEISKRSVAKSEVEHYLSLGNDET